MGVHTVRGINTLVPDRGEQAARGATPLRRPQPPPPSPATFDGRWHGNGGSLRHRLLSTRREGLFAVRLRGPFGAGARAASHRCRSLFRHAGAYSSSSTPVRVRFGYTVYAVARSASPRGADAGPISDRNGCGVAAQVVLAAPGGSARWLGALSANKRPSGTGRRTSGAQSRPRRHPPSLRGNTSRPGCLV